MEAIGAFKKREVEVDGKRRKVFELSEEEMRRAALQEQERLKRALKQEKVGLFIYLHSLMSSSSSTLCQYFQKHAADSCVQSESSKSAIRSFWIPTLTPSTDTTEATATKPVKLTPICPGSTDSNRHTYSLKALVDVHFTEEKPEDGSEGVQRICPSCKKVLNNGLKAMCMSPLS